MSPTGSPAGLPWHRVRTLPDMLAHDAAKLLGGVHAFVPRAALRRLFERIGKRLSASPSAERRALAAALAQAIASRDYDTALSLAMTAAGRTDLGAEKVISRRYRFLWIANPKVASRSMIAALRAADPAAELVRERTLDEILERRPETRDYFTFAFVRHPCTRTHAFHADKHARAAWSRRDRRWFIEPYHGVRLGMSFPEFCHWLNTPCGSDAFADRHWLSQHRQMRTAEGRLPDFIGRWENLDADWRAVGQRLGMPTSTLPRMNASKPGASAEPHLDPDTLTALRQRYATDFTLGGYAA